MGKFLTWIFGFRADAFRELYGRLGDEAGRGVDHGGSLGYGYGTTFSVGHRFDEDVTNAWDEAEAKHG